LSYANDVLVYRQGRDRERITAELQNELDCIDQWCGEAGFLVNPTKATITFVEIVERTHVMKYIGVLF
jgi:hypothetical protein